jgi:hypothetical protein
VSLLNSSTHLASEPAWQEFSVILGYRPGSCRAGWRVIHADLSASSCRLWA